MRELDGGQAGQHGVGHELLVVEPDDRQVPRDVEALLRGDLHHGHGDLVGEAEERGGSVGRAEDLADDRDRRACGGVGSPPHQAGVGRDPGRAERLLVALPTQACRDVAVAGDGDEPDPVVPGLEHVLRGQAATHRLVGHDGVCGRAGSGPAVEDDGGHLVRVLREGHLAVVVGRHDQCLDVALEHRSCGGLVQVAVAAGVDHDEEVALLPGRVLGSGDHLPAERDGRDPVGEQAERMGLAGPQPSGQEVRHVSELLGASADLLGDLVPDAAAVAVVQHERDRGDGYAEVVGDVLHREHAVSWLGGASNV